MSERNYKLALWKVKHFGNPIKNCLVAGVIQHGWKMVRINANQAAHIQYFPVVYSPQMYGQNHGSERPDADCLPFVDDAWILSRISSVSRRIDVCVRSSYSYGNDVYDWTMPLNARELSSISNEPQLKDVQLSCQLLLESSSMPDRPVGSLSTTDFIFHCIFSLQFREQRSARWISLDCTNFNVAISFAFSWARTDRNVQKIVKLANCFGEKWKIIKQKHQQNLKEMKKVF